MLSSLSRQQILGIKTENDVGIWAEKREIQARNHSSINKNWKSSKTMLFLIPIYCFLSLIIFFLSNNFLLIVLNFDHWIAQPPLLCWAQFCTSSSCVILYFHWDLIFVSVLSCLVDPPFSFKRGVEGLTSKELLAYDQWPGKFKNSYSIAIQHSKDLIQR